MNLKLPFTLMVILATTAMTLIPSNVKAQSVTVAQANCVQEPQAYIPPETLAMMAYRGAFEEEGIPGYTVFATEYNSGKVTAAKIVEAAVNGCVLSNKYGMAEQKNYIADVGQQVQLFLQGRN
ncbi:hypothetical protein PCC7424_1551 [Gloeothece citriformis PCC 7424]|uniref:Uncharacterized protein n=1 Tax=Gloeothece citriformis (strain PCC 7424) TaxID=65393 RepID=B7K9M3_GLOC7|nr:hypothetical protein [Gloeothece citriformis]ACK69991.1 hypothetical protein PCC7424_1551 [Gloeothece citriformis PCC 7424]